MTEFTALARRYWWVGLTIPVIAILGVLFYYSLSLRLPGVLVAFGSVIFYLIGIGVVIGLPFAVSNDAPRPLRHRVFRFYNWLSQKAIRKALLIKRDHAGVDLCASKVDAEKGSERVKLDGEWQDYEDVADRMYYADGPLGIGLERSTLIIDPIDAAIGSCRKENLEAGEEIVEFGGRFGECVIEHATLPEQPPVVDLADATYLLGGNGEPTQARATEEFEKKAWYDHQSVPVLDIFVMAGLFSAILFVIWLAFSFAADMEGGGGGGSVGSDIVSGFLLPMAVMEWRYRR